MILGSGDFEPRDLDEIDWDEEEFDEEEIGVVLFAALEKRECLRTVLVLLLVWWRVEVGEEGFH